MSVFIIIKGYIRAQKFNHGTIIYTTLPHVRDNSDIALYIHVYILYAGAYEPPKGRQERPTPHYSVERHLNLNGCDTSLIWTYSQVGHTCCFYF